MTVATRTDPNAQWAMGASSTTSDTVDSRLFLKPSADAENAITVKRPNSTWGVSQAYGKGQVFALLKDAVSASDIGYTGVTPDDFVVARMDREGNIGTTGGIHVDTGLRQPTGYTASYSVGITPSIDTTILNLKTAAGATQPFIYGADSTGTEKFRIAPSGNLSTVGTVTAVGMTSSANVTITGQATATTFFIAGSGLGDAGQVAIGAAFGLPSINFGTSGDCYIHRSAAGTMMLNPTTAVKVNDAYMELDEVTAPGVGGAGTCRLYIDNGGAGGKSRLMAIFSSGAAQAVALQP